jgi:tight adherence protein C
MLEMFTVILVFTSVALVTVGLRSKAVDPVEARLRTVQAGMGPRNPLLAQPFIRRAAAPMASGLVRLIMRLLPHTWLAASSQKLIWAGNPITLPGFVLIWSAITALGGFCFFIFSNIFTDAIIIRLIITLAGVGLGAALPQLWLRARVNERHYYTRKAMPDALDLMTTSVEAGLSLDAAMIRVAEFQRGPFQDELAKAMQDITLGKSRRQALEELCERLNAPEAINFVQTINQAEVTGAPIAQVLRVQAEQVRIARRQAAEAQAQRAPLLMVIPLVFLILPSIFVFLVAPAALTIIDLLSNSQVFNR